MNNRQAGLIAAALQVKHNPSNQVEIVSLDDTKKVVDVTTATVILAKSYANVLDEWDAENFASKNVPLGT